MKYNIVLYVYHIYTGSTHNWQYFLDFGKLSLDFLCPLPLTGEQHLHNKPQNSKGMTPLRPHYHNFNNLFKKKAGTFNIGGLVGDKCSKFCHFYDGQIGAIEGI